MRKDSIEADLNNHFSRYEDPLWDEETHESTSSSVIEVKVKRLKDSTEWVCLKDGKQLFILRGKTLTIKQNDFMKSVDGLRFMLSKCRAGCKTAFSIKKALHDQVKSR